MLAFLGDLIGRKPRKKNKSCKNGVYRGSKGLEALKDRIFGFEPLERRELLAVCHWIGATGTQWSVPENWQDNQLPAAGDSIQIDYGAVNSLVNDNPDGTIPTTSGIEFSCSNRTISGNSIPLSGVITVDANVAGAEISAPLTLSNSLTVNVADGQGLTVSGDISGSFGVTMSGGVGTLTLSGGNTYSGGTTVNNGILEAMTPASLPYSSAVAVDPAASIAVSAGGAGQWTSDDVDTLLENPYFTGGNLILDVSSGTTFSYSTNGLGSHGFVKSGDGDTALERRRHL